MKLDKEYIKQIAKLYNLEEGEIWVSFDDDFKRMKYKFRVCDKDGINIVFRDMPNYDNFIYAHVESIQGAIEYIIELIYKVVE